MYGWASLPRSWFREERPGERQRDPELAAEYLCTRMRTRRIAMIQAGRVPSSVPMVGIPQIAALLSPTRGNAGNLTRNCVANRRRRPLGGGILVGTAVIVILL